ncbi:protein loc1 [Aspergillus puulaauensis]|uniref:60S ribosomal subunit assembly/export protein n=1 Tax=Aspergillus puulaauensis TaxID=1220207 RepID=A0A7R7XAU8_9EURO|nr:60S ribosomal subunit assembly/export protein [Aspergillus puulaauensis]BCS17899.1 60S ribosomal subunit assembly/export protein [Aspergillus puulaauensis]
MGPTKGAAKPKTSGKGDSKSNKVLGSKVSKKNVKRPPPKEVKSKARTESSQLKKTKKREYSEAELDLPKLNMITPVGVMNPKGKKKGKTFVDDPEAMMTIFAMVNAEKEGQIESKIMKARQLEEIREAKKKEAEARQSEKKNKLENVKDSIRQNRKGKGGASQNAKSNKADKAGAESPKPKSGSKKKSVAFA